MIKKIKPVFLCAAAAAFTLLLLSWGRWGHQHINRAAVFALPAEMRPFFYNHIDYITEEAAVPDIRRGTINDKAEPNRHFIDLENYLTHPGDSMPQTMKDVTDKFDARFIESNGILPWYMEEMMDKLTRAFRNKQKTEILFLAADLAHYIGDAHMPLHTSANYDGQMTGQQGIHSFWESQLPEAYGNSFNFYTGDAVYIPDVHHEIRRIIAHTHSLIDTLLAAEKTARATLPEEKRFEKDASGNLVKNRYNQTIRTKEYAAAFHQSLNGMVEKQLRLSIAAVASFWYTAWVNAGKPDLGALDPEALTQRNRKSFKKDYKLWQKGHLFGFKSDNEF